MTGTKYSNFGLNSHVFPHWKILTAPWNKTPPGHTGKVAGRYLDSRLLLKDKNLRNEWRKKMNRYLSVAGLGIALLSCLFFSTACGTHNYTSGPANPSPSPTPTVSGPTASPTAAATLTPTATPSSTCTQFTDTFGSAASLNNYNYYAWGASTAAALSYQVASGELQVAPASGTVYSWALAMNSVYNQSLGDYTAQADFK